MEEHYTESVELPKKVYPDAEIAMRKSSLGPIVTESIELWEKRKGLPKGSVANVLQWDGIMGCYCFIWAGIFLGVEIDGHIHS